MTIILLSVILLSVILLVSISLLPLCQLSFCWLSFCSVSFCLASFCSVSFCSLSFCSVSFFWCHYVNLPFADCHSCNVFCLIFYAKCHSVVCHSAERFFTAILYSTVQKIYIFSFSKKVSKQLMLNTYTNKLIILSTF